MFVLLQRQKKGYERQKMTLVPLSLNATLNATLGFI